MQQKSQYGRFNINTFTGKVWAFFLSFWAVVRLLVAKKLRRCSRISLNPVASVEVCVGASDIEIAGRIAEKVARCMVPGTRHPCLYRSFARAELLRAMGAGVVLNIGMRKKSDSSSDGAFKGHCWVTLNDKVLFEQQQSDSYPLALGDATDGVCYWLGAAADGLRAKK